MSDKKMTTGGNQAKNDRELDFGLAIAIGLSFGLLFGTALGNAAMGITIGLLLAGLANAYHEKKQGKKGANIALAIIFGGLVLITVIWIVTAGSS